MSFAIAIKSLPSSLRCFLPFLHHLFLPSFLLPFSLLHSFLLSFLPYFLPFLLFPSFLLSFLPSFLSSSFHLSFLPSSLTSFLLPFLPSSLPSFLCSFPLPSLLFLGTEFLRFQYVSNPASPSHIGMNVRFLGLSRSSFVCEKWLMGVFCTLRAARPGGLPSGSCSGLTSGP